MAASTKSKLAAKGCAAVVSLPCGPAKRTAVPAFGVAYLAPSPDVECGACHQTDRPLWWGICGWCGADEEDFEAAA